MSEKKKRVIPNQTGRQKISDARFLAAVPQSGGMHTVIARRLGIDRHTVAKYIKDNPILAQAVKDETEGALDSIEATVIKAALAGDMQAAIFYLKHKGKDRGFSERLETEIHTSRPIMITLDSDDVKG